jgi:HEAT repeat protein
MSRIASAAAVRPDETRTVALVAAVFASLETGRGIGEAGANALVLARLSADVLPYLFVPLGAISLVVALGYGAGLGRVRRARLLAGLVAASAAVIVAERVLLATGLTAIAPILWLTVNAVGALVGTVAWTVAGSSFDARQAKRLFPLCTAAAIVGNFVGAISAGPVAAFAGTETLVVVQAAMLLVAAWLIVRIGAAAPTAAWGPPPPTRRPLLADVGVGFDEVRHSPLLRLVAVAYVLFAVLFFSVTFPFLRAAEAEFPDEATLAGAIGLISAAVTAASFAVSVGLANRFYARFGIAAAALLLPIVYLAGFAIWIVAFSFSTAVLVLGAVQVAQRGLSNAAWSAFYNVVPAHRRAQVLAFNDGVPGQLGIMLSGVLLLLGGRILLPEQVFWMGAGVAIVTAAIVLAIRRRYAASLLRTLRSGIGEQVLEGGPGLGDLIALPEVREALVTALGDPEPRVREIAATMLARAPGPDTLDGLLGVLEDEEPTVRAAAAVAMIGHDAVHPDHIERAEAVVDQLLSGGERERLAGLDALRRLGRAVRPEWRSWTLDDPAPEVRAAAVATLVAADDALGVGATLAALEDRAAVVRHSAAAVIASRPSLPVGLPALLDHDDLDVQASAMMAMDGHGPEVRDRVLVWADRHVERAGFLARAHAAVAAADEPRERLLAAVLGHRLHQHQDLALGALAVLGAPEARGVIRRCLRSGDSDVRAQAIEALDALRDQRLGGAIARLLDEGSSGPDGRRAELLDSLRHDGDPWIRVLARSLDPSGDEMTDVERSIGEIDRMMELRRVPLFERLGPEDLQRVASVAVERSFETGTAIVREGELGDELFVILEGDVRVERAEPDGSSRRIRAYHPGDHFGELAVLRERPRAATVVAEAPVRTLAVSGGALMAILRERPEAAMAMLATLAERISTQ